LALDVHDNLFSTVQ